MVFFIKAIPTLLAVKLIEVSAWVLLSYIAKTNI